MAPGSLVGFFKDGGIETVAEMPQELSLVTQSEAHPMVKIDVESVEIQLV